jgi:hypothetical protein
MSEICEIGENLCPGIDYPRLGKLFQLEHSLILIIVGKIVRNNT